jgi:hypothetical protein
VTPDLAPSRFWPWSLIWAVLFAVAHGQSPDFYSNQHQYLLHGLANAGFGHLNEDWLANTRDPTPAFTWLATITNQAIGAWGLHAIYFLLLGAYFEGVRRLVEALPGFPDRGPARVLFLTLFLAVHACVLRVASAWLAGVDYPWYLQAGLAAQYLLGPGLQPSAFGVLLILSLAAYANGRPVLAGGLAAAAAVMHSTYLLPAGLLVLGYLAGLVREGQRTRAVACGALALAVVLPAVGYNLRTFLPEEANLLKEAQRILARERIPHHAVVERWLDTVAVVQHGVMVAGLIALRRTRLFLPLLVPTVASAILSVFQVVTDNDALALLFPWRFSVVLMPVAVAVLLARVAREVARLADAPTTIGVVLLVLVGPGVLAARRVWVPVAAAVLLVIGGVWVTATGRGYQMNEAEGPLLDYVREHTRSGEVYLLPTKFPTLKKEKPASQSKTFVSPVRTGQVGIPVDLQRFRLTTGAPIYVDFKAVPYEPAEVLEWHRRVSNCQRWYAERDWDATGVIDEVVAAGITHVVAAADKDVASRRLELVYADDSYRLYRIKMPSLS